MSSETVRFTAAIVTAMMNSYWCSKEYVAFLLAANCSSNLYVE